MKHIFTIGAELLPACATNGMQCQTLDLKISSLGGSVLAFLFVFSVITMAFGTFLNTIIYNFVGLVGVALGLTDADVVEYGVVSIGIAFPSMTGSPDDLMVQFMQFWYFVWSVGAPIVFVVLCAFTWFVPMTYRQLKQAFAITEILHVWAQFDMWVIALTGALREIPFVTKNLCSNRRINVKLIDTIPILFLLVYHFRYWSVLYQNRSDPCGIL